MTKGCTLAKAHHAAKAHLYWSWAAPTRGGWLCLDSLNDRVSIRMDPIHPLERTHLASDSRTRPGPRLRTLALTLPAQTAELTTEMPIVSHKEANPNTGLRTSESRIPSTHKSLSSVPLKVEGSFAPRLGSLSLCLKGGPNPTGPIRRTPDLNRRHARNRSWETRTVPRKTTEDIFRVLFRRFHTAGVSARGVIRGRMQEMRLNSVVIPNIWERFSYAVSCNACGCVNLTDWKSQYSS